MMHSKDEDPLTERYQNRIHRKYEYTTEDLDRGQDKGKAPVNEKDEKDKEAEEFAKTLLETMQNISKEIKEMRVDRMRESLRIFHQRESSDMSHFGTGQPVSLPQAPQTSQRSTMPTFFAVDN